MSAPGLGTPRRTDVVVVGGGVTGSAAARALARRGLAVVLLERLGRPGTPAASHRRDADRVVAALQVAAAEHGAVVRHHREVLAVEPAPGGGVLVRCAAGAAVRAGTAVVAAGPGSDRLWPGADVRPGHVLLAAGSGARDLAAALAVGREIADLVLLPAAPLELTGDRVSA
ncbi:FAD-dependent oxidoreductase [Blastococcus sp. SYSU D00669]